MSYWELKTNVAPESTHLYAGDVLAACFVPEDWPVIIGSNSIGCVVLLTERNTSVTIVDPRTYMSAEHDTA